MFQHLSDGRTVRYTNVIKMGHEQITNKTR